MVAHSQREGLNNRVMMRVKRTMEQLQERMQKSRFKPKKALNGVCDSAVDMEECLGRCLCKAFYDQVCEHIGT